MAQATRVLIAGAQWLLPNFPPATVYALATHGSPAELAALHDGVSPEQLQLLTTLVGGPVLGIAEQWLTNFEKAVADEERCRSDSDDSCAARPICEAMAAKNHNLVTIKQEKANPAGVVSLSDLHDLGQLM